MSDLKTRVLNPELTPFERLVEVMAALRSSQGCNWDRKQTHQSLLPYLLEEAYEVIEVIETGRDGDLCEELGDLLIQIVFHAQIASERGDFTIDDSVNRIVEKMIARHPHVFGDQRDLTPDQVNDQWEKMKTETGEKETVLGGVPRTLPALTMAFRIGEKASGMGFDWHEAREVLVKVSEEVGEIQQEFDREGDQQQERLTEEIGDLLFATASLARKLDIDPEHALRRALMKFRDRFGLLEASVKAAGKRFDDLTLDELEGMWQANKGRDVPPVEGA